MREKKKYMICSIICLFAVLLFGGCGKKKTEERWDRMFLSYGQGMCICDQGMIRQIGTDGKHAVLMTFFDPESGVCAPICTKVNCSHDTDDCDARFGECVVLAGDHLYYADRDPEGQQIGDRVFVRADADGTNRKVLQRIQGAESCLWPNCEEGYLIYPYFTSHDENGAQKEKDATGIWLLDLETEKLEHIEMPDAYGARIVPTTMTRGVLYYFYSYSTVDWTSYSYEELIAMDEEERQAAYRSEIWKYDPATKEKACVLSGDEVKESFFGGGWLIREDASSGKIILTEPEGKKKLEVTPPYPAGEYGTYYRENEIYFYSGNEVKRYRLTDKKWEDMGTVDCDGGSFRMLSMTEHWVYIQKYDKDRSPVGIFYMPREAFLEGKSEWKKVAEFEN